MQKNILRDVLPSERRSIRNISMSDRDTQRRTATGGDIIYYEQEDGAPLPPSPRRRKNGTVLFVGAGVVLVVLAFFLSGSVRGATVTVSPKSSPLSLNADFTAARIGEQLKFTAVPLILTAEEVILAEAMKKVSERASGIIIVYNNYSKESQRLIKNTRFESPKGLIYRIDKSIVIPGQASSDGKTVPGSIEVAVYADSPGEEYNSAPADFTIPGFKNDRGRFAGFYARSKTSLTGGIDGIVPSPTEEAQTRATQKLRERLQNDIRARAQESAGEAYVLYDNALVISFESLPLESRGSAKAAVREQAVATAYLFRREELAGAAAGKGIRGYNGLPVEIKNLDAFSFTFLPPLPGPRASMTEVKFKLQGEGIATWQFSEDGLKEALLGKRRNDLAAALSAFPTIEKIDVAIRPFWSRNLPENPKKIDIKRAAARDAK